MKQENSVGKSLPRTDGAGKVRGDALYIDDIKFPDTWYGVAVRRPEASARIISIDTSRACEDSDVVVITASDLEGPNIVKLIKEDWPILAEGRVNHPYEAIALVAAPTRERAESAASKVDVVLEELPFVETIADALNGDPRTGGEINVLAQCRIESGDLEEGFRDAPHIVEGVYECGHQEHIYIETNGVVAHPGLEGGVEIVGSLQCPYYVQKALAFLLEVEDEKVVVKQAVTGGGFGGKEDFPDMISAHAALLALRTGKSIKIIYERQEDINSTTKRHPARIVHRTAVAEDGSLLAMDIEVLLDGGAYVTLSPVVLSRAVIHAGGAYRCPNVRIRGRVLATNTAPNGAFRGFGAPQSIFGVERHMDKIARYLGMDPYSLRFHNAYRVGDTTPTGQLLSESVSAVECLEEAVRRSDYLKKWKSYEAARLNRPDDGEALKGIGLSLFWHGTGFTGNGERVMKARAATRLARGGKVEVLAASTDIGQGTNTVFAQIVADALRLSQEHVVVVQPDTSVVPDSGPTVASRTVMIVGGVLERVAKKMGKIIADFAAEEAGVRKEEIRLVNDVFVAKNNERIGSFSEVADRYLDRVGPLRVEDGFKPMGDDAFDEETYQGIAYPVYGWGCDVMELEVDPDTLITRPVKMTTVVDVGKVINPVLCRGQVEGGTLQAIAWGYLEEIKLEDCRYLNDRLTSYIIPTTLDSPDFDTVLLENPAPTGPFGAKGVGELPMDGGAPAVVQAIENASGIRTNIIPATPERLLACRMAGDEVKPISSPS